MILLLMIFFKILMITRTVMIMIMIIMILIIKDYVVCSNIRRPFYQFVIVHFSKSNMWVPSHIVPQKLRLLRSHLLENVIHNFVNVSSISDFRENDFLRNIWSVFIDEWLFLFQRKSVWKFSRFLNHLHRWHRNGVGADDHNNESIKTSASF